jgi:hypothetical protein
MGLGKWSWWGFAKALAGLIAGSIGEMIVQAIYDNTRRIQDVSLTDEENIEIGNWDDVQFTKYSVALSKKVYAILPDWNADFPIANNYTIAKKIELINEIMAEMCFVSYYYSDIDIAHSYNYLSVRNVYIATVFDAIKKYISNTFVDSGENIVLEKTAWDFTQFNFKPLNISVTGNKQINCMTYIDVNVVVLNPNPPVETVIVEPKPTIPIIPIITTDPIIVIDPKPTSGGGVVDSITPKPETVLDAVTNSTKKPNYNWLLWIGGILLIRKVLK